MSSNWIVPGADPNIGASSAGGLGAIQFSDGAGGFEADIPLTYDPNTLTLFLLPGGQIETDTFIGATTQSDVVQADQELIVNGTLTDVYGNPGLAGQVLSSTGVATEWIASGGGGGGVSSLNTLTGAVSLQAVGNGLAITTGEGTISIETTLDPALANRLQITTASGINNTIVNFNDVQKPSVWIPDAATQSPTNGAPGWRSFKQVGSTGAATQVQWYPYNPFYGQSLPYTVNPGFTIAKKDLSALWAVIKTTNKINVQGVFFFNIYQYDIANPPAGTYNKRTDYAIYQYPTKWGGPATVSATLNAGYRYLVCAVDTPKDSPQTTSTVNATALVAGTRYTILTVGTANWTAVGAPVAAIGCVFTATGVAIGTGTATYEVNTSLLLANGVTPTQTTFLRDPYNIHTTMPHITLNTVANATPGPLVGNAEDLPISAIVFGTTSSAVSPTLDFSVEYLGYSTTQGGSYQYEMVVQ